MAGRGERDERVTEPERAGIKRAGRGAAAKEIGNFGIGKRDRPSQSGRAGIAGRWEGRGRTRHCNQTKGVGGTRSDGPDQSRG
jgi:hypothetical protein